MMRAQGRCASFLHGPRRSLARWTTRVARRDRRAAARRTRPRRADRPRLTPIRNSLHPLGHIAEASLGRRIASAIRPNCWAKLRIGPDVKPAVRHEPIRPTVTAPPDEPSHHATKRQLGVGVGAGREDASTPGRAGVDATKLPGRSHEAASPIATGDPGARAAMRRSRGGGRPVGEPGDRLRGDGGACGSPSSKPELSGRSVPRCRAPLPSHDTGSGGAEELPKFARGDLRIASTTYGMVSYGTVSVTSRASAT